MCVCVCVWYEICAWCPSLKLLPSTHFLLLSFSSLKIDFCRFLSQLYTSHKAHYPTDGSGIFRVLCCRCCCCCFCCGGNREKQKFGSASASHSCANWIIGIYDKFYRLRSSLSKRAIQTTTTVPNPWKSILLPCCGPNYISSISERLTKLPRLSGCVMWLKFRMLD